MEHEKSPIDTLEENEPDQLLRCSCGNWIVKNYRTVLIMGVKTFEMYMWKLDWWKIP